MRYWRRDRWDRERALEVSAHLQMEIDENLVRGMNLSDAVSAAQRKFGNQLLVREEIYGMNTIGWLESLWQDLRFGARLLRMQPGFTAIALASLALGIGANASMFQLLDAVRLRSLPVERPQELARIQLPPRTNRSGSFTTRFPEMTLPQWDLLRAQQEAFSGLAAFADTRFNLATGGEAQYADGLYVNGGYFRTLGVEPVVGRTWTDDEDRKGCGPGSAVISFGFWQSRFGGKPDVLQQKVLLNGHSAPIIGVAPAGFFGLDVGRAFDIAVPICSEPLLNGPPGRVSRRDWWLTAFGRLDQGWSVERASAHLKAITPAIYAATIPTEYRPEQAKQYLALRMEANPGATGASGLRREFERPLWILLAMTTLVLLIACANLANLMLARGSIREREVAVRLAIGASRARIIRQLLSESLLLSFGGAVLGALLAIMLTRILIGALSTEADSLVLNLSPDWRMFLFLTSLTFITCALFGLAPAWRVAGATPSSAMKAGARTNTAGRERFGMRRILVISQVALSLVLLVGALLFVRSFTNLMTLDAGFRSEGVLVTSINLRRADYPRPQIAGVRRQILEEIRALPGVESAADTSIVPIGGGGWNENVRTGGQPDKSQLSDFARVSEGYFGTLGMPLLQGRDFDRRDTTNSSSICVVNQSFVKTILNGSQPIGQTFNVETGPGEPRRQYEIVGVVKDAKYRSLRNDFGPTVFVALIQEAEQSPGADFLVRSNQPLSSLVPPLKRIMSQAHPSIGIEFRVFRRQIEQSVQGDALMAILSSFFGVLAAVLAVVGLYGIISYTTGKRRNEIGVRMALGADRGRVIGMVMGEAGWMIGIGLVVGTALAIVVGRAASSLLFGVEAYDVQTVGSALALLAVVALAAGFVPALRASRLNPMTALRDE